VGLTFFSGVLYSSQVIFNVVEALVKAINHQLDAELEKAILEGKDYLVWTQPHMHDIEYDLRGIKNARKEGQTHLVWA
jgi:hypothetical protein